MFRVRVQGGKNERRLAVKKVFEVFFFFQEKFILTPFQPAIPTLMTYETRRFYSDISIRGPVLKHLIERRISKHTLPPPPP